MYYTNPKAHFRQLGKPEHSRVAQLEAASEVVWGTLAAEASIAGSVFTLTAPANGLGGRRARRLS